MPRSRSTTRAPRQAPNPGTAPLLRKLEGAGRTVVERSWRRTQIDAYASRAQDLGITNANRSATDYSGSIYVTIERARDRTGGAVDAEGHRGSGLRWSPDSGWERFAKPRE